MTKYFMVFAFLLLVTFGNTYFFGSKKDEASKLASGQQDLSGQQEHQAKTAKITAWKETEYQHYSQSRRERMQSEPSRVADTTLEKSAQKTAGLESSGASDRKKPQDKKAKVDRIEYVKVPFKGSYILVSRDYYKVNGMRKPLSRKEAEQVARQHGAVLPTKEMVDAIWEHADLKLQPQPLQAGPLMTQQVYFTKHDGMIDKQIGGRSFKLVAGHKKDIIRSQRNGRVTIYGWQRANGAPIQPVSSVHGDRYTDYSNCLRLVKLPS
jgi:hypothetical protein